MNITINPSAPITSTANQNINRNRQIAFTGQPSPNDMFEYATRKSNFFTPIKKLGDKCVLGIRNLFVNNILSNKYFTNFAIKNSKNKKLMTNLGVLGATIISAFYVKNTLQNKKLDKDRKVTLAINQGLVWGVSTAGTYALNNFVDTKIDKLSTAFKKANKNFPKIKVDKWNDGIRVMKSMFIMGLIYRYISPVIVTPVANKLGDRIIEKRKTHAKAEEQPQVQTAQPTQPAKAQKA